MKPKDVAEIIKKLSEAQSCIAGALSRTNGVIASKQLTKALALIQTVAEDLTRSEKPVKRTKEFMGEALLKEVGVRYKFTRASGNNINAWYLDYDGLWVRDSEGPFKTMREAKEAVVEHRAEHVRSMQGGTE